MRNNELIQLAVMLARTVDRQARELHRTTGAAPDGNLLAATLPLIAATAGVSLEALADEVADQEAFAAFQVAATRVRALADQGLWLRGGSVELIVGQLALGLVAPDTPAAERVGRSLATTIAQEVGWQVRRTIRYQDRGEIWYVIGA